VVLSGTKAAMQMNSEMPVGALEGHAFKVCIHTENQNQVGFFLFVLHEISVLTVFRTS